MKTEAARAAKLIKTELKIGGQVLPKLSVKSSTYSGGDSINVNWVDGTHVKEIEAIIGKYQYGNFNGQEDIYEYTNSQNHPQAKYIFAQRDVSYEFAVKIAEYYNKVYGGSITIESKGLSWDGRFERWGASGESSDFDAGQTISKLASWFNFVNGDIYEATSGKHSINYYCR